MFWELTEISIFGTIRVFCSTSESLFGRASFRWLGFLLWLLTSCVWDVLWYRIFIKTAFVSWAKQKLSKTTLSTFQKCLFELCSAWFFNCKWKSCFESCWDLCTWNNTCFLFKCRVTFRLRQFSKGRFGIFALYFFRLRCLVISNT